MGSSQSVRLTHTKTLGDTGLVSMQSQVEQCTDAEVNGQLFSDLIPKYIAFTLQGVIKPADPVCPCMKQEYLKQVEQIFLDEVSYLHGMTGKTQ